MTEFLSDNPAPDACPHCRADFDAGPIPESIREYYAPPYRWSRRVGLSDGDSVYAWRCPDCGHEWLRGEFYRRRAARAGRTATPARPPAISA